MPITRDQELWACALHVEKQHGKAAASHCVDRMAELKAAGDDEGAMFWYSVLERLAALDDRTAARN
jgi:hypothetical protein